MDRKIFFEDARKNILELFSYEFPTIDYKDIELFAGMFYRLLNYEEEGKKIRPTILITSNINAVVKAIPKTKKICIYEDENIDEFKAHIKALMCFCMRGWYIYINFGESSIEYGIIKRLTSIKEKSLVKLLSDRQTMETVAKKTNIVLVRFFGGGVINFTGGKGFNTSLCFNLNSQSEYNWESEIAEFVDACVLKLKTTKKKLEDIKVMLTNIFSKALTSLHGTICMVIDKEYKDKNGFLSDGTWLKEPIEFAKMFIKSNTYDESTLRCYADVLTTMLDFDGITVIDNAGRIRAYNIFIESNSAKKKIVGGARRRAAYSILENKNKKIIGVYFQSQDGDNFYKEKSDLKKKNKIKIVGGEIINNEENNMLPLEIIAKLEQAKKLEEEKKLLQEEKKLLQEEKKLHQEEKKNEAEQKNSEIKTETNKEK